MSLKTIKEEVRFLTNDVTVLEKVVLEKRAVLNRAIATMQSRCTHPESSILPNHGSAPAGVEGITPPTTSGSTAPVCDHILASRALRHPQGWPHVGFGKE